MKKFTFYWKNGNKEILNGMDVVDALSREGYTAQHLKELAFYFPGENHDFHWVENECRWNFRFVQTP